MPSYHIACRILESSFDYKIRRQPHPTLLPLIHTQIRWPKLIYRQDSSLNLVLSLRITLQEEHSLLTWSVNSFILVVRIYFSLTELKIKSHRQPLQNYLRTSQKWVLFLQSERGKRGKNPWPGDHEFYYIKGPTEYTILIKWLFYCIER